MSKLCAAKQLAKKKNWSADDLAQIIGYVMMGETPAFIADRLYLCQLDVREVIQETLLALPMTTFHNQARKSGLKAKPPVCSPQKITVDKLAENRPLPVWKKRRFVKPPVLQVFKAKDFNACLLGDPPPARSALSKTKTVKVNYEKQFSPHLAKIKELCDDRQEQCIS